MIITPDMGKEPGTTAEETGPLLELADVEGWDDVCAKVTLDSSAGFGQGAVILTVDSTAYPAKRIYLDADDAAHLGRLLTDNAAALAAILRNRDAER